MEIQKIFSDQYDEERYYSVLMDEEELMLFSEAKKKVSLRDVDSHKGIKRAILTSPFTGGGSLSGGYFTKEIANKLDDEGLTDEQILTRVKDKGGKIGAATAAGIGLTAAALTGTSALKRKILALPVVAGLGYVGGRQAAKVNTKDRLAKRAMRERNQDEK